jgi:type I restriction enzyme S subunit
MKFKRYAQYKDSGVEWLGEIPEHWCIQKLKYVASVRFSSVDKKTEDGERPTLLCNYQDVYYNDYITPDISFMEATASPTEIACFMLRKGDVIVTKDSESWDDIAVSAYVPFNLDGVLCGYHLSQIHPDSTLIDGEYLFRAFCAHGINDQFRVAATGITRYGLGKYWLDNAFFPVPTIDEQHTINKFLNREITKIDALIEKKEKLIELLQEKRNALITHAVTKGLDPNVPMKDSGVE